VLDSEEEEYEEEDEPSNWYGLPFMAILIYFIGYLVGDNEPLSDDEMDAASLPGLPDVQVQDLKAEARRVVARTRCNT
jgi:hypothetical protein